ncbi:Putative aliphatic sulfonates transport permease protein SsuC [Pigmentiphaga humi]|uniref:Aliphatic sulfonates transport permease protein SsuC n=1 Tax=Pigmentiphaga humi TaxID=2478468 RepID=A0A3P4B5F6_9BURK|nr:ABC transporter permease subunit [Pigmentiphaga humi]VCU71131.1 Putative aliphatic sulfonates transport permease protein SsuC [Pigmentiphaga humi]
MKSLLRLPGVSALLVCLALLLAWQAAALLYDNAGLPTAGQAMRELPAILADRDSLLDILGSLRRMVIGFALALAVAAPIGLMMGRSALLESLLNPLLMVVYPIPKAALMPLIMLWLGVGDASKILVVFLGVSLPLLYHSYQGARAVEEKMLWSAAAMGMNGLQRMVRVVLPAALPEVLTGCRTGIVMGLITMITSEMIARQDGAGNILFNAMDMAQYELVYAMIVVIGALGILLDVCFESARARLTHWADRQSDAAAGSL